MIILNVIYTVKPETSARAFLDKLNELHIPEACRAETGNLRYDYYFPADDSHTLFLLEMWQDEESLAAHQQMPHFLQIAPLKDTYIDSTEIIKAFDIASIG